MTSLAKVEVAIRIWGKVKEHPVVASMIGAILFIGAVWKIIASKYISSFESYISDSASKFDLTHWCLLVACSMLTVALVGLLTLWIRQLRGANAIRDELEKAIENCEALRAEKEILTSLIFQKPDESFSRFEDIFKAGKIKYGFVDFWPTIVPENPVSTAAKGLGVDLLNEVFDSKIVSPKKTYNWKTVFDGLIKGEFSVIATPLYDIRERRQMVDFCSPLFYSDIGVFTSAKNPFFGSIREECQEGCTFSEFIERAGRVQKQLIIRGAEGEIHMKLAEKYFPCAMIEKPKDYEYSIASSIRGLLSDARDDSYFSDFFFCERAQAEMSSEYKSGQIVSLLTPGQLLFPVAFAVRKGEDTLRKFINLRLLGIDGSNSSGILNMLIASTKKVAENDMTDDQIRSYYRRAIDIAEEIPNRPSGTVVPFGGRRG